MISIFQFDKLNLKKFNFLTILFCWANDLFTIFYVVMEIKRNDFVNVYLDKILILNGLNKEDIDPTVLDESRLVIMSSLWIFLLCFLILNNVNYYFFYKGKKFAKNYVSFISWTGIILTSIIIIQGILSLYFVQLLNLFSIPLYLFIILGLKKFYPKN